MEFAPWPMAEVEGNAHVVQAVNPAFCALLGKNEGDLIGKPIAQLFKEGHATHGLLDRVQLSGEAATYVETASDTPGPIYWSYTCWPLQAKEVRHVGLMIQVTETSTVDQQTKAMNEALLISSVQQHELTDVADRLNVRLLKEVAEREEAQQLLRQNHETFVNLIENAPFGMYVVDAGLRMFQMSSASKKVFANVTPLMGRDFREVVHAVWPDPFASDIIGRFHHTLETGEPYTAPDMTQHRVDIDAVETYDWKIERITLPDGQFGVVCYFYDITERKRMQLALEQTAKDLAEVDRRKSEFLATLAHELRNPLAPLRNGLEVLTLAQQDKAVWDQAHSMMKRQLDQMVLLIDDLMDLSRISRGAIELRKERLDLRTLLEQAVEAARPFVERQGHTLVLDLPERPVLLDGDAMRLAQVFNNLLNNAAKYTDRGGAIAVRVDMSDHEATVAVEDNGIGIAPDQLVKVFDMFAQVERTSDRVQGGLGIGLNIVKHLVTMHGGRIVARSGGLGKGSSFSVILPLASRVHGQAKAQGRNTDPEKVGPKRVLVVDDNVDAATMMAMLLRKLGHEVRVAHNGEEGLQVGASLLPQVVLMDLGMPVMDGYSACRLMRGTPWGERALIIALSGWGQDEDRHKSTAAGFDHHLVKPIPSEDILALLGALPPDEVMT
ncbi:MAG: response regulator [Flavobacteriales bacterium]|nr:response regulator [Flavobacteriales bacterium]